jgi:hypothetical protein
VQLSLFLSAFGNNRDDKVIHCLVAFRKRCMMEGEESRYNHFLLNVLKKAVSIQSSIGKLFHMDFLIRIKEKYLFILLWRERQHYFIVFHHLKKGTRKYPP